MQPYYSALTRALLSTFLLFGIALLSNAAIAADGWEEIAPFIEPDTIAVARVDLTEVDFERSAESIYRPEEAAGAQSEGIAKTSQQVEQFRQELVATGAERVWVTLNFADIVAGPAILIPSGNAEATADLFRELPPQASRAMGGDWQIRVVENMVLMGPPATIERLGMLPAATRPEIAQTLATVSDFPIALAVVPNEDMRRVLREMLPDVPEEWGGASGEALAGALSQLAAGVDLSPPARAIARIEGSSEADAEAALPAIRKAAEKSTLPIASDSIRQEGRVITFRMDDSSVRAIVQALVAPIERARESARRSRSSNNLKQFGLAMHNYHDVYKHLPPSGKASDGSAAGLSWRVHLLPFLEQGALYKKFKLDEPWDSPHNRPLIAEMPEIYRSPLAPGLPPGKTTYQLPRMEGSIYGVAEGEEPPRFRDVEDGLSNTVLIFESNPASAVTWTQPDDLKIDPENPWPQLRVEGRDYVPALIGDGSAHMLSPELSPETLRAMITRAGGEDFEW